MGAASFHAVVRTDGHNVAISVIWNLRDGACLKSVLQKICVCLENPVIEDRFCWKVTLCRRVSGYPRIGGSC